MEKHRVGLDVRTGRRISVGMATYIREVSSRLPRVAPDFEYRYYAKGENLGLLEQVALPLQMRRDRVELAHFMAHYVPAFAGGRFIFTIHDLIHLRFVRYFKAYIGPYYRTIVRRACRNAARIITSDEKTIADLTHYFNVDPAKIRVIPLAPRERFLQAVQPYKHERPYLLNVGNHREHKDIPTLLKAWASLPESYEIDLFLTGPDDLNGALQRHSTQRRQAVALGDVSDEQLAAYYAGAQALVHPALLEGFGLPLVEALACGCPVVATAESLPAALSDVALTFAARDVEAARAAIMRLLDDRSLRTRLTEEGQTRARALTWDLCAQRTAGVYHEVFQESTL
jgi:glycosyltransferase involved in cell wall biosynthesis